MKCVDENVAICFVAGELTDEAASEVDRHMDECPDCLVRIAAFARTQATSTPRVSVSSLGTTEGAGARTPAAALRKGTVVGRYVVFSLVGAGAMGSVYSAADPVLRRTVALKLVRASGGDDLGAQTERLVREARLLAQVAHPNVVAVHDVGTFEGHVFIAMDLVEGQTLREWLEAPRSAADIVRVFVQAGQGLVAAHAAGVVHRDFKPDNVLVGNDGRVVVTDFGLARDARGPHEPPRSADLIWGSDHHQRTQSSGANIAGTPAYMAPEQLDGAVADQRADQFSFCVALYEAFHGGRPSVTGTVRIPAPRRSSVSIPGRVRRAIGRGLSKVPEHRYPTMAALLAALTRDPWKGVRRYGAIVVAAAIGVTFLGVRYQSTRREIAVCHDGSWRSGVWDGARKSAIHAAFLATGKAYAEDTWGRVERALDAYTEDWATARTHACESARVRHEQPASTFEVQNACFVERLNEVRAVTDVLASADDRIVMNAPFLPRHLAPLALCSTGHFLHTSSRPDPAIAPAVARLRAALARGRVLREIGRMKEALATVQSAADESAAVGYLPLEASALLELGLLQSRMDQKAVADETMARAARVADSAGEDGVRVRALSQRIFINGSVLKRPDRVAELDAEAGSALHRMGSEDPRAEESYRYAIGLAFRGLGDFDRAFASVERAVALSERAYGPTSYDTARGLSGLCLVLNSRGDVEGAIPWCERAMTTFRDALGPTHPDYAIAVQNLGSMQFDTGYVDVGCKHIEEGYEIGEAALGHESLQVVTAESNLGACMSERGEYGRALALLERALPARERIQGPSHLDVAQTLTRLGTAYLGANKPDHAITVLERALRIRDEAGASPSDRAATRFPLARALWESGRDRRRASALAKESLHLVDQVSGKKTIRDSRERAEIETWLAHHTRR